MKATTIPKRSPKPEPDSLGLLPLGTILLDITVAGHAVPWTPSRVTANGTYKPKPLRQWQNTVAQYARLFYGNGEPYWGPVDLALVISIGESRRGDATNILKGVEDALQKIVYANDKQVTSNSAAIRWDGFDRVHILVKAADA